MTGILRRENRTEEPLVLKDSIACSSAIYGASVSNLYSDYL
jgi:hypothetical protein